ncbi:ABC transporter substrate-binding protein [Terribacillus sp. 179-K 1B1 HS]|uniref:ABC transporter substrate-binding protein n=1 Tax=Terribacillus sp. 179-K 1B1 HS TaxID=3142388 RepID=UPI0039A3E4EE
MTIIEHCAMLYRELNCTDKVLEVKMAEISDILSCSVRNAKIIIRKLEALQWIEWVPGKGRENCSTIKLLKDMDSIITEKAKALLSPDSIDSSLQFLMNQHVNKSVQREFIDYVFRSYLNEATYAEENEIAKLQFPSYRPLPSLDPAKVCRRSENHMMRHIFSPLVVYKEDANEFHPHLAHHWKSNQDYTKWTFYLQKGVRFHNGKEMTADDVRYSFLRHRDGSSPYKWIVQNLSAVNSLHTYAVEFLFLKPCHTFLHLASCLGGSIVPASNNNAEEKQIGTGPYRIVENNEEKLKLKVFDDYFLRRPFLDEINLYFLPALYDNHTVIDSHISNQEMNFYHYPYIGITIQSFEEYTFLDRGSKLLTLNLRKGLLAEDRMLRKAIYHFLAPEQIIKDLGGTRYKKASRLVEKFKSEDIFTAREAGRSALASSKYMGETLTLMSYQGAGNETDASWIQKKLLEEGINIQISICSYDQLHELPLEESDFLLGEHLTYENELYTYLAAFKGNHSLLRYHLPQNDVFRLPEMSERRTIRRLCELEDKLIEEYGQIHLYKIKQFAFYPSYVKDVHFNSLGWIDFTKIWYEKED